MVAAVGDPDQPLRLDTTRGLAGGWQPGEGGRSGQLGSLLVGVYQDAGPTPAVVRLARWAPPDLVAEVAFAEWTSGATLRHPRYIGIRTDKAPREVVCEG